MKGLLIVNGFLESAKLSSIYDMLKSSANKLSMELECVRSSDLLHEYSHLKKLSCDFVLFWDKDVLLSEMLEDCGFPVFNSSSAVFLCDNKAYTAKALGKFGVNTPKTFASPMTFEGVGYTDISFARRTAEMLHYPLILKEAYGSFGQQVYMINNENELCEKIASLAAKPFIMQEAIKSSFGRDVRVNVVGDKVICSMLRYSVNGDFRSNISNGGQMEAYSATEEQCAAALSACRALGLDFAGVDVMFGKDGEAVVCEVNSNPHFLSSYQCTGVDLSYHILKYIKDKLQ